MNNEYPENPEQQRNQEQYGNQQEPQQRNTQGQSGNQQDQQGPFGNQQGQQGPFGNQQGHQGGILSGARDMAENQIDQTIDQYANKIPGGSGLTKQAKEAVGGILDNLEKDGENRLGELGGGLFGGNKGNQ